MLSKNLALVPEGVKLPVSELTVVAAALQKQAQRDFAPIWNVTATVSPFARLEDVPGDYWPVIIVDDVEGAAGYHDDEQGQPLAFVEVGEQWSLTASHEICEMLADPFGNRLVAGRSPKPKQGRVNFLVEVCDPTEGLDFAYSVNGVMVSDFYTPNYFDPTYSSGVRYSFSGAPLRPRKILAGGYLSWWVEATGELWQTTWFSGSKPRFVNHGVVPIEGSLRATVDRRTKAVLGKPGKRSPYAERMLVRREVNSAATKKATRIRAFLESCKNEK